MILFINMKKSREIKETLTRLKVVQEETQFLRLTGARTDREILTTVHYHIVLWVENI